MTRTTAPSRLRKGFYPAPLALAIALSVNAHAATIVVNSADPGSVADMCTITDAVAAVNTAAAVNGCVAGSGNDIIDLSTFTSPTTITFEGAAVGGTHALVLTNPVTISGPLDPTGTPLVTLTRDSAAGTSFGIIGSSAALTLFGLQITNGDAGSYLGGGVLGATSVTIMSSVVSGNRSDNAGGGIAVTGPVTIKNSIVTGNTAGNAGGGVYGNGRIEIDYSTISNNSTTLAASSRNGGGGVFSLGFVGFLRSDILGNTSASAGGGVYAAQGMTVTDSTISGNIASNGSGGGLYSNPASMGSNLAITGSTIDTNTAQGNGGGVLGGGVGIQNSTLTGNVASGTGGGVQAGDLMTAYATIAQNQSTGAGGGANFSSTADATATILFGNTANGAADDIEGASTVTGQYNIIGAATVGIPADSKPCDPMLSPLADNGGPTQTMALGAGSCAIDAASATPSVTTDQRNFTRPTGSGTNPLADIGAYEAGAKDPDVIFADGFGG